MSVVGVKGPLDFLFAQNAVLGKSREHLLIFLGWPERGLQATEPNIDSSVPTITGV